MLGRFGPALRWDLHRLLGLDLNEWLRGERDWRDLYELKDQLELEQGSAYLSAVLSDRELAEQAAHLPEPEPGPPRLRGYTTLMSRLDDLLDAVLKLQATTAGADPRKVPDITRPKPEVDLVRRELDAEALDDFVDLLLGI
ncbi:hypothetical protein G4X40_20150 [Rhodococcus sp. D2-41]|uniref:hypothetical protein n=1 Tax=Speluncibacter jeojiensis TaxID=2710754 RepID=UPI00240EA569|nr:hypothetical protein [Rhodococcus sp. D2-41]MDG3012455.1 hypothetical protein [Rhodococcus sp. D2-41]